MRGGTASCSVTISDESVGSPIIDNPDVLIVMNLPSLDKYEKTVKNFFIDNYNEEIKDGDLHCADMYYYSKDLKKITSKL